MLAVLAADWALCAARKALHWRQRRAVQRLRTELGGLDRRTDFARCVRIERELRAREWPEAWNRLEALAFCLARFAAVCLLPADLAVATFPPLFWKGFPLVRGPSVSPPTLWTLISLANPESLLRSAL